MSSTGKGKGTNKDKGKSKSKKDIPELAMVVPRPETVVGIPPPSAEDPYLGDNEGPSAMNVGAMTPVRNGSSRFNAPELWQYKQPYKYLKADDVPDPIKYRRHHQKGVKVQDGVASILKAVGSKYNRDVVRRNQFMSQAAFDKWNAKHGNKYWAGLQDYDEDGIETEFVVRRKNAEGPVVAVNGYTTKLSDWDAKRAYYEKYPSYASRKQKNRDEETYGPYQSYQDFIDEHYGFATDKYGFLTDESAKAISDHMKDSPYNLRIKVPSAYNLFTKNIIFEAYKFVLDDLAKYQHTTKKELNDLCNKKFGFGWVMSEASTLWNAWVKQPIIEALKVNADNVDYYETVYKNKFIELKQKRDEEYEYDERDEDKFHTWLFNQKEIKAGMKEYVQPLFDPDSDGYQSAVDYLLDYFTYKVNIAKDSESPSPKGKIKRGTRFELMET